MSSLPPLLHAARAARMRTSMTNQRRHFRARTFATTTTRGSPPPPPSRLISLRGILFCSSVTGAFVSYLFSDQLRQSSTFLRLSDVVIVPLMRQLFDAEDAHSYTIVAAKWNLTPLEVPRVREAKEITNNLYKRKRLLKEEASGKTKVMQLPSSTSKRLETTVWGRTFPNPIGMAAGFDKHAEVISPLLRMGFGFIEIGGVT